MKHTKIDWCDYSWNPVTGCLHGCSYCYAKRIAERFARCIEDSYAKIPAANHEEIRKWLAQSGGRILKGMFPYGFKPTLYEGRLNEPQKIKRPSRIFTVSMGDLFGDWVPRAWLETVLDVVKSCPQHSFIFLTKNPKRYGEIVFPKNAWVGVTVTSAADLDRAAWLERVYGAEVKFLSIEPMLGALRLPRFIDWVIIGAQTGPKRIIPKREWIDGVVDDAKRFGISVFVKQNIPYSYCLKEFPKSLS